MADRKCHGGITSVLYYRIAFVLPQSPHLDFYQSLDSYQGFVSYLDASLGST
jgi:hypothetical protein